LVQQKGGERREGEERYLNKIYVWFTAKKKCLVQKWGGKRRDFVTSHFNY
jgi:hypothetical protein